MKRCPKCTEHKVFEKFYTDDRTKDGYRSWCKVCVNKDISERTKKNPEKQRKRQADWRKNNPGSHKKYELKILYGLSLEDKNRMLISQNNRCAGCDMTLSEHIEKYKKDFCVDHNHKTGQIRQLLCIKCNLVLGKIEDNPERIMKLLSYLERHNSIPLEQSNIVPFKKSK